MTPIKGASTLASNELPSNEIIGAMDSREEKINIVKDHFVRKGYRVHSGLQFGCELVLYADDPSKVHSDFCIHIIGDDGMLDWREMQTLVRSMPDFHKTLVLANVRLDEEGRHVVDELAMATEHAPFRHKQRIIDQAGLQRKKIKTNDGSATKPEVGEDTNDDSTSQPEVGEDTNDDVTSQPEVGEDTNDDSTSQPKVGEDTNGDSTSQPEVGQDLKE